MAIRADNEALAEVSVVHFPVPAAKRAMLEVKEAARDNGFVIHYARAHVENFADLGAVCDHPPFTAAPIMKDSTVRHTNKVLAIVAAAGILRRLPSGRQHLPSAVDVFGFVVRHADAIWQCWPQRMNERHSADGGPETPQRTEAQYALHHISCHVANNAAYSAISTAAMARHNAANGGGMRARMFPRTI